MAKRAKIASAAPISAAWNHYGRVYLCREMTDEHGLVQQYRGVIWDGKNSRMLYETGNSVAGLSGDPEMAYAKMREYALTMGAPVDLWRYSNQFVETVNTELPF